MNLKDKWLITILIAPICSAIIPSTNVADYLIKTAIVIFVGLIFAIIKCKYTKNQFNEKSRKNFMVYLVAVIIDFLIAILLLTPGFALLDEGIKWGKVFFPISIFYLIVRNISFRSLGFSLLKIEYIYQGISNRRHAFKLLISNIALSLPLILFYIGSSWMINKNSTFNLVSNAINLLIIIDICYLVISSNKVRAVDLILKLEYNK